MTMYHKYDAVVVGAGGAGLMAALQLSRRVPTAVLSKLYPTRSHTGTAQGGIGAALGNLEEDHWEWHAFDTVKGGDYLSDQDAVDLMCREAIDTVYELEHDGLPFSRTPDGRIDQRPFGGHTRDFGKAPVKRACYAADRTGHMILQTLYQQCIKNQVNFFNEYQVLDILVEDNICRGVVAVDIASGELHTFHAKAVILATGGFGRIYRITSNALSNTGDSVAQVLRRGLPLEDMEFYQFHPTGIYKMGILITEAARGEGAILLNGKGERFMQRYAPTLVDLAPRDMVSRAMYDEIRAGRGVNGRDYFYLDVRHLGRERINEKLPDITDFVKTYLGLDPAKDLIPIQPTAHYAMGGIPTDLDARVLVDTSNTPVIGLYAAGECACVSVHGANRLGTNSLVDIIVFGRRAGKHAVEFVRGAEFAPLPPQPQDRVREELARLLSGTGRETVAGLRQTLQNEMWDLASIVRVGDGLKQMKERLADLRDRYSRVTLGDRGRSFNTELLEAVEFGYLLDLAETIVVSALAREESRGAHFREDFPQRDDARWLRHTFIRRVNGNLELGYKPVTITRFQPQERKY